MTVRELVAGASGERIDRYLAAALADLSRAQVQRLIGEGLVTAGGAAVRPAHRVTAGERLRIEVPPAGPSILEPQAMVLDLVYEDADLLVVDKPAGLSVHPGPGHPDQTLVNGLLARIPDLGGIGGELRPGIVHRLDKDTSGLLIVAKTQMAHTRLTAALAARRVQKTYLALVRGVPDPVEGTVDAPVGRDPTNRQRMALVENGREARTHYRVLGGGGGCALLEVRPETGRTHQIRVPLASIRHPIVGDSVYGRGGPPAPRQMLHAWRLRFDHPITGATVEVEAAPPADFAACAAAVGVPRLVSARGVAVDESAPSGAGA